MNIQVITVLILKVIGAIRLFNFIVALPYHYYNLTDSFNYEENTLTIITVSVLLFEVILVWSLLFKSKAIISILGLVDGIEDNQLNIKLDFIELVKLVFIFLGVMLLINSIIPFLSLILDHFKSEISYRFTDLKPSMESILLKAGQIAFGIIMVVYHKALASWVSRLGDMPGNSSEQV